MKVIYCLGRSSYASFFYFHTQSWRLLSLCRDGNVNHSIWLLCNWSSYICHEKPIWKKPTLFHFLPLFPCLYYHLWIWYAAFHHFPFCMIGHLVIYVLMVPLLHVIIVFDALIFIEVLNDAIYSLLWKLESFLICPIPWKGSHPRVISLLPPCLYLFSNLLKFNII